MDTSDVLLAARDALREHGWTRGGPRRRDGSGCLVGGLLYAEDEGCEIFWPLMHLAAFCRNRYGNYGANTIAYVNDRILTSEDEACDLLEAAAKWDGGA